MHIEHAQPATRGADCEVKTIIEMSPSSEVLADGSRLQAELLLML